MALNPTPDVEREMIAMWPHEGLGDQTPVWIIEKQIARAGR